MKISDNFVCGLVFVLLFIFSFQYLSLLIKVPFSLLFVPYRQVNMFESKSAVLKKNRDFFKGEKYVGYVSDVDSEKVFLQSDSIFDFFAAQYAIVPSILVNDTEEKYVIGIFYGKDFEKKNMKLLKKLDNRTYIFEGTK